MKKIAMMACIAILVGCGGGGSGSNNSVVEPTPTQPAIPRVAGKYVIDFADVPFSCSDGAVGQYVAYTSIVQIKQDGDRLMLEYTPEDLKQMTSLGQKPISLTFSNNRIDEYGQFTMSFLEVLELNLLTKHGFGAYEGIATAKYDLKGTFNGSTVEGVMHAKGELGGVICEYSNRVFSGNKEAAPTRFSANYDRHSKYGPPIPTTRSLLLQDSKRNSDRGLFD